MYAKYRNIVPDKEEIDRGDTWRSELTNEETDCLLVQKVKLRKI